MSPRVDWLMDQLADLRHTLTVHQVGSIAQLVTKTNHSYIILDGDSAYATSTPEAVWGAVQEADHIVTVIPLKLCPPHPQGDTQS